MNERVYDGVTRCSDEKHELDENPQSPNFRALKGHNIDSSRGQRPIGANLSSEVAQKPAERAVPQGGMAHGASRGKRQGEHTFLSPARGDISP
jgi:hypothetical protein